MPPTDRAGFQRKYGVHIFRCPGAPFVSFGIHVDWHTPTLDIHLPRITIQVGKNNWDNEGRFEVIVHRGDGHTDQCTCARAALEEKP